MAIPSDWSVKYQIQNRNLSSIADVRAICPYCRNASTFAIQGQLVDTNGSYAQIHLFLRCNFGGCKRVVYVRTAVDAGSGVHKPDDPFFIYPSRAEGPAPLGVPESIADDWLEGLRALAANAPKAAAVMFRRVLYGVLMNKECTLAPLRKGLEEIITKERLPKIFDEWLAAIKDDGHDAAHPDRALAVSAENINETCDYTFELLRFVYIEPAEFKARQSRNGTATK